MSNDDAFTSVLAGCTEAAQNMDLSDMSWMPPDGNYDLVVHGVMSETRVPGRGKLVGVEHAVANVTFLILGGEFEGREFRESYWIPPESHWGERPPMGAVNLARLATCIAGHEEKDPATCFGIVQEAAGEGCIRVQLKTERSEAGKNFTKITYLNALESTEEVEEDGEIEEEVAPAPAPQPTSKGRRGKGRK